MWPQWTSTHSCPVSGTRRCAEDGSVGGADEFGAEIVASPQPEATFKALATAIANERG